MAEDLKTYPGRSIFIDSSKLDEIKKWDATGIIDGVTTNQMIMYKDGVKPADFNRVVQEICQVMESRPVSIELSDSTASEDAMVEEAKRLNSLANNIVIKVPLIPDTTKSLVVANRLAKENIAVNMTTMMTYEQMIIAALATRHCKKPSFISLFWARSIDDHDKYRNTEGFAAEYPKLGKESFVNAHPSKIVEATAQFLKEGNYSNPQIIIGSIRSAAMVGEAFAAGAHVVTITPDVLNAMLFSKRTVETIKDFDEAWKNLQSEQ